MSDKETILDIGPETVKEYARALSTADTIVWNGPMGYYEREEFREGTMGIAKAIAKSPAGTKIAGGGDVLAAIHLCGITYEIQMSTGGGAMLAFLEKQGKLPGILPLLR